MPSAPRPVKRPDWIFASTVGLCVSNFATKSAGELAGVGIAAIDEEVAKGEVWADELDSLPAGAFTEVSAGDPLKVLKPRKAATKSTRESATFEDFLASSAAFL